MNYLVYFLRVCNVCILFQSVTTYVLFAANLDDFKSIAKKFIPAKLADQLADMASPTSIKYLHKAVKDNEGDSDKHDSNETGEKDLVAKSEEKMDTKSKKRFSVASKTRDINIDEIVEKVKLKLEKEYKNFQNSPKTNSPAKKPIDNQSLLKHKQNSKKNVKQQIIYDSTPPANEYEEDRNDEEMVPEDITDTEKHGPNINEPRDEGPQSKEAVLDQPETAEIENLFQEMDMRNSNDSYEDYVTPKKDETIEIADTEHSKISTTDENADTADKVIKYVDKIKWKAKEKVPTPTYDYGEEVKAITESLFYDDNETVSVNRSTDGVNLYLQDNVAIHRPIDGAVRKIKKAIGTMIPTRETYKMSSPNYYAKLPVVAEKYNFDEPIPERDREPEKLKYFGNPPASINRKVKL